MKGLKEEEIMANILDYLYWRGDLTLDQVPLNEVDALILARLSYLPLDKVGLDKTEETMSIGEAARRLSGQTQEKNSAQWKRDMMLLRLLEQSGRFRDARLLFHVDHTDSESQTQFAVVTISPAEDISFLSFRGTDDSLIGWKEDFNMCFTTPVPGQSAAVAYLNAVAEKLPGRFLIGGHSKGGNFSMYAAAFCKPEVRKRIDRVFNFDGPGFQKEVLERPEYDLMKSRMQTFVPQSSVIGMLFEHEEERIIVDSDDGVFQTQHNIYTWNVEPDRLSRGEEMSFGSRWLDAALKGWLEDLSPEKREKLVDGVYEIMTRINQRMADAPEDKKYRSILTALSEQSGQDAETKELLKHCAGLLVKNVLIVPKGNHKNIPPKIERRKS